MSFQKVLADLPLVSGARQGLSRAHVPQREHLVQFGYQESNLELLPAAVRADALLKFFISCLFRLWATPLGATSLTPHTARTPRRGGLEQIQVLDFSCSLSKHMTLDAGLAAPDTRKLSICFRTFDLAWERFWLTHIESVTSLTSAELISSCRQIPPMSESNSDDAPRANLILATSNIGCAHASLVRCSKAVHLRKKDYDHFLASWPSDSHHS